MRLVSIFGLGLLVPNAFAFHSPVRSRPPSLSRVRGNLQMVGGRRAPSNEGTSLVQQGVEAMSAMRQNILSESPRLRMPSIRGSLVVALMSLFTPLACQADDKRHIGEIPASGIIFKDTINVEAFADPKVQGVTLYVSDFRRPLAERLAKDFFSDPAQASITCVKTGPITLGNIDTSIAGEEVFSEARSLLFKTIRVRRLYDKDTQTLVYVSYSTRFSKNDDDNKSRFKSSLCAVSLREAMIQPLDTPSP